MDRGNERLRFRGVVGAGWREIAVLLLVLGTSFPVSGKGSGEEMIQTYRYPYDLVFQAAQDAIERLGCFVQDADKDKGIITGRGTCANDANEVRHLAVDIEIHIEAVSPRPETRVTAKGKVKIPIRSGHFSKTFLNELLAETQKVLVTYK